MKKDWPYLLILIGIVAFSFIVHEYGHMVIGIMYGYNVNDFGIIYLNGMYSFFTQFDKPVLFHTPWR